MIYRLLKSHIGSSHLTTGLKTYTPKYVFSSSNDVEEGQEQFLEKQVMEAEEQQQQQDEQHIPPQEMQSTKSRYTAQFLLSDNYQFYRDNNAFRDEMKNKLKAFEQHVGLSLYNLEKFPLYLSFTNSNHMGKNDYQFHKIQALKSMKVGNFTIPRKFIEQAIKKEDFEIIQGFLKAEGQYSNWIIGMPQINLIFKLYVQNPQSLNRIRMLQCVGFSKYMITGSQVEMNQKERFFDEHLSKIIHNLPSMHHKDLDKFRFITSLLHLQGPKDGKFYNEKYLSYLVRQLCNIKIGYEFFNLSNEQEQKQFEKQLKQTIYLTYGEKCIAKIMNQYLRLFPKYDIFLNAVAVTIATLHLLHAQLNENFKIHKVWPYFQLYNIANKTIPKKEQKIFYEIIPKAIFQESSNPKLYELYIEKFKNISNANLDGLQQQFDKCSILTKKIIDDVKNGQLKITTMNKLIAGSPPKVINNQQSTLSKNKTLIQKQFVKKLNKGNYVDALHYIDKNLFKNTLSIQKQYGPRADRLNFQSENDRALFILKQYMNDQAYKLIPQNLQEKDFEIDEKRQPRLQQPFNELDEMKKQKIFAKNKIPKQKTEFEKYQISNVERIQKPKYNSHQKNKDPSKITWNKSKKKNQNYDKPTIRAEESKSFDDLQMEVIEGKEPTQNKKKTFLKKDKKPKDKGKFEFSTQKQTKNDDGYQTYRNTVKSMGENKKNSLLNFDKCSTVEEVKKTFQQKMQFLNSSECHALAQNSSVPFIAKGSHLLCYFLIESAKTKPKKNRNNLEVKLDSSLGQIFKDYSIYLEKNAFEFALTQETYSILLEDQVKNFHRRSFKTIISHMIAYTNIITDQIAELIAKITQLNKTGITLLEITSLIVKNKMQLTTYGLEKLISGIFLFGNLNEDGINLYAQYCQLNNQKIRPMIFSKFFKSLLRTNNQTAINKSINRIISIISQKPYYFSKQLTDKENAERQKIHIKQQKTRYYSNLYQIIKLAAENSHYVLPGLFQQLFETYLANRQSSELSADQYCVAAVVFAGNKDKFNQWINMIAQKPEQRVSENLFDQIFKIFKNNEKLQIHQKFDQVFDLTLFKYPQKMDIANFQNMIKLFVKYDRPAAFSQFIDTVLRSNLNDLTKYKYDLTKITNDMNNDFSRNEIKDKLNLLFKQQEKENRIKYKERRQKQELKIKRQQEKQRQRKIDVANIQKQETQKEQTKNNKNKNVQVINTGSQPQEKIKPQIKPQIKKQKTKEKKIVETIDKSGQKAKQVKTEKKISLSRNRATWENAPKKMKRNISLKRYFDRFGRSTQQPQDKKAKGKGRGKK